MHHTPRPRPPWRPALVAFALTSLLLALVAVVTLGLEMRSDLARAGAPLARAADAAAEGVVPARISDARAELEATGLSARLVGPAGRVRVQTGSSSVWSAGAASPLARLAAVGGAGWSVRDGALEATRTLPSGDTIAVRAPLAPGATSVGAARGIAGVVLVLALLVAGATWLIASRARRRLVEMSIAAEAAAAGRASAIAPAGRGEWRRLSEALSAASARNAALQAAAEAGMETMGAALAPLAHPMAARTPSGGLIRNDALERLVGSLAPQDAVQIDDAVRAGLAAAGPVSRRIALADGRAFEMEGWAVPGGRVVAVGERTEQARMAAVRRQLSGAAARHLQAPVNEIQALGSDLLGQVPPAAVPAVRRIQAAGDRMERLVAQLLRGTANDPRAHPLRLRPVGVAGVAYGLGTAFDRRLRDRGLRLETDLATDLPPVRTDAALLHEILSELIANAATFTPRGGVITLSAREVPGGRVHLSVTDTGPGIGPQELPHVSERFMRGAGAAGFPGAGLGLGVAQALAERLGGRLILEAGPGGRARLELPAALVPAASARAEQTPAAAAAP